MKSPIIFKFVYVVVSLLFFFNISCQRQPTKKEQIENVRNSVVSFLLRFNTDGKKIGSLTTNEINVGPLNYGSGFFINGKYIVTALHVKENLEKERKELGEKYIEIVIQKFSPTSNEEFTVPVSFVMEDKENDLAIYSFNPEDIKKQWSSFNIKSLMLAETLPEVGDEILLTGFFDRYKQPLSSIGNVAMISEKDYKNNNISFNNAVFIDATSLSGHSGGPVYSFQTQKVVGILTRVLNPNNDRVRTSVSSNSLHLIKLLNDINLSKNNNQNTSLTNQ